MQEGLTNKSSKWEIPNKRKSAKKSWKTRKTCNESEQNARMLEKREESATQLKQQAEWPKPRTEDLIQLAGKLKVEPFEKKFSGRKQIEHESEAKKCRICWKGRRK